MSGRLLMLTFIFNTKGTFRYPWLIFSLILLGIVVGAGWFATGYLGDRARQEIIKDNESAIALLSAHLTSEMNKIEGAVKALSGSPWIAPALISRKDMDIAHANSALDRYNAAVDASVSYLMGSSGITIASSNRNAQDSFVGKAYQFRPYFTQAIKGNPGRYFALGVTSLTRGFYASFPVRDDNGTIVGVVAMKKDFDEAAILLRNYPYCFLVDPHGIIFLSGKRELLLKSLWPINQETHRELLAARQFGEKPFEAVMSQEVTDGMYVTLDGINYLVSRNVINPEGWSIVLMAPTNRILIYKSVGVIVTLLMCILIIVPLIIHYNKARSAERIRESEELYRTLAEMSFASVYVVQDGKLCFLNANALAYSGYTVEELLKKDAISLVHAEDKEQVKMSAAEMLRGNRTIPYEFRLITKAGQARWIMETVTSIVWGGKRAILGNSMDITERKKMEEGLITLSITDLLTGLYNRRGFIMLTEQQLRLSNRSKRGMMLFFTDLDGMKWINDTLGHEEGDRALMEAADVLKEIFRSSDIIARIGGDEFAILAIDTTDINSEIIAARLQNLIDIRNRREGRRYTLSVSIGSSFYDPESPCSIDELMAEADKSMYEHKKSKRCPDRPGFPILPEYGRAEKRGKVAGVNNQC
jgi:diguanylate cyclase (GGDEF)-like protein/PAS domain S-box-containing protein